VFVTKCNYTVQCQPQALFNTYWNGQAQWDFASVSKLESLENRGNSQIMYAQYKALSAASNKKDCVWEKTSNINGNRYQAYAVSVVHPQRPDKFQNHARSFIVFHSCYIVENSPGVCDFTFVWCYDFNGWIHDKFIEGEKGKVATRMNKIIRSTPGAAIVPNPSPFASAGGPAPNNNSASYQEYNNVMREAQPVFTPTPNPAPVNRSMSQPFKPQPAAYTLEPVVQNIAPTSGPNFCPGCGAGCKGMRFCASCGYKMF